MEKIKYIGLDISTSIVGISFFSKSKELIDLKAINLKKIKCIFSKANKVKEDFADIVENYNLEEDVEVAIEESFQSFSKGFSSAKTLSQLNRFNGIVSYLSSFIFNCVPVYVNVNSARKILQIKLDKKLNISTKDQVFNWVREQEEFTWPTKTLKSGPNKGLVKYDESCYDMSDAYVICKAHINNNERQHSK